MESYWTSDINPPQRVEGSSFSLRLTRETRLIVRSVSRRSRGKSWPIDARISPVERRRRRQSRHRRRGLGFINIVGLALAPANRENSSRAAEIRRRSKGGPSSRRLSSTWTGDDYPAGCCDRGHSTAGWLIIPNGPWDGFWSRGSILRSIVKIEESERSPIVTRGNWWDLVARKSKYSYWKRELSWLLIVRIRSNLYALIPWKNEQLRFRRKFINQWHLFAIIIIDLYSLIRVIRRFEYQINRKYSLLKFLSNFACMRIARHVISCVNGIIFG